LRLTIELTAGLAEKIFEVTGKRTEASVGAFAIAAIEAEIARLNSYAADGLNDGELRALTLG
jgi:hypothetical protein